MATPRSTFPLRLRSDALRGLVREVAEREHISQNELIEQAIEHEVVYRGALIAADLQAAASRLAAASAEQHATLVARSIEEFAAAEAAPDPLGATGWAPDVTPSPDPATEGSPHGSAYARLGVVAAFESGR